MKVLYITANPKPTDQSLSLTVGKEFIEKYQKQNPNDEVVVFDLYKENVPEIDSDVFNAWGKLGGGADFLSLTTSEQEKITAMNNNLELFMSADKYIISAPLWNFGLPPVLKAFIDNVTVARKTFHYTENGPEGLLKDRKAIYIQASGGVYSNKENNPYEHGYNYIKTALGFMGITDLTPVLIEGVNISQERKEQAITQALELVETLSKSF